MSQYIYMNHRIRENPPSGPVIVCLREGAAFEADEFVLHWNGNLIGRVKFDRNGLEACETHDVRAWVELADDVEVTPVSRAAVKKPKRKVKVK